jgi:hypothetical protein
MVDAMPWLMSARLQSIACRRERTGIITGAGSGGMGGLSGNQLILRPAGWFVRRFLPFATISWN